MANNKKTDSCPKTQGTDIHIKDSCSTNESADQTAFLSFSEQPPNKRIKVDPDDTDKLMEDQRRGRIELDKGQRDNLLRWILTCHIRLTSAMITIVKI